MTSAARAYDKQVPRVQSASNGAIVFRFPSNRRYGGTATSAREAFRTFAYIKLQPADRGTQLQVTLRSHQLIAAFMTSWIALAALFDIPIAAVVLAGGAKSYNLVVPLLIPAFGVAFIALGRFVVRSERKELLDFVSMVISPR
jgi:Na+/alanine symporter